MANLEEQESEFAKLVRLAHFSDQPRPDQAELLRQQALARFESAETSLPDMPRWRVALQKGVEIMRRPRTRLVFGVATIMAVLAGFLLLPTRQSTVQAFGRFAEALVQAKTARYQMQVNIEGQGKQTFQAMYLAPAKHRQELGFLVNIADMSAGKMLSLNPTLKTAFMMNVTNMPKNKPTDSFERLRELLSGSGDFKQNQVERLGDKQIDGKKAVGFRLDSPMATVTMWGDPKTGLPVHMETVWSGIPRTEVVMSNFEINVPLKESLFDMKPPAGYKLQSMDVDASPSQEKDLVAAFEVCSQMSGEFPETFDTAGMQKLIIKYALDQAKKNSDEKVQQLMKDSVKIGRGFQFAFELPASAEAHYAGKGVKPGTKDKPIFWYKLPDPKQYRVIDADFTIHDVEKAPQIQGARRIEKASKLEKFGRQ